MAHILRSRRVFSLILLITVTLQVLLLYGVLLHVRTYCSKWSVIPSSSASTPSFTNISVSDVVPPQEVKCISVEKIGTKRQRYFLVCFLGGWLAGALHFFILPLDMVKCRVQVGEFRSFRECFLFVWEVEAVGSWKKLGSVLMKGWVPAIIGYCAQGSIKFLLYEFFKSLLLSDPIQASVPGAVRVSRPHWFILLIFLLAGAAAEAIADVLLVPWETMKVQMQLASNNYPSSASLGSEVPLPFGLLRMKPANDTETDSASQNPNERYHCSSFSVVGVAQRIGNEPTGLSAFYQGLAMIWMRQVPYATGKFLFFELFVASLTAVYYVFHSPIKESNDDSVMALVGVPSQVQLYISLFSGFFAGGLGALVSHPADTLLSRINLESIRKASVDEKARGGRTGRRSCEKRSWRNAFLFKKMVPLDVWGGLSTRMLIAASLTAGQWVLYDAVKVCFGFTATGSVPRKAH